MNQPTNQLFDSRIADWLEADPNDAPPQILEIVVAAIPSIPQRTTRRIWSMNWIAKLGLMAQIGVLTAAVLVAVVAFTMVRESSIGPRPSPTPTAPLATGAALTLPVNTAIHYYTAALPAGWTVSLGATEAEPDTFVGPEGTLTIRFQIIPAGVSQDAWLNGTYTATVAGFGGTCRAGDPNAFLVGRVGAGESQRYELACLPGWIDVTAVGDRGYGIDFKAVAAGPTPADLDLYRQILLAFALDQGPTRTASPSVAPASTVP